MNSRRVVLLLIAAALVIGVATLITSRQHAGTIAPKDEPLLKDLKAALNQVSEVRIAKAQGDHTTLRRHGQDWSVNERDFPADGAKVRKLLIDLSQLKALEEKTSNPELYSALDVEDSATRVDIVSPAKTWGVIVGKSAGYKEGYVRLGGAKQSYLAAPHIDADAQPQRWLEQTIVDIPEARIQSVAVKPSKGPAYTVSRDKKEEQNFKVSNIPPKRKLSYDGAGNALARGLESLSLDDLHKKPEAAPAPQADTTVELSHATYKTFDGVTVDIEGRKESKPGAKKEDPKTEKFFITLSAGSSQKATQEEVDKIDHRAQGKEFEVSSYKFEGLFKPMEDLLEALPQKDKDKGKEKEKND